MHGAHGKQGTATYYSTSLVPGIDHLREGQNAANSGGNVGSVVTAIVGMMQLPNELELELPAPDVLAPDVHHAAAVARQHELALEPFVLDTFVEDT